MKTSAMQDGSVYRRNFVSNIISAIPGFKDYAECAEQYAADLEMRRFLATNIGCVRKWLRAASSIFAENGSFRDMLKSEKYDTLLGVLEKKILSEGNPGLPSFKNIKMRLNPSLINEILDLDAYMSGMTERMCDAVRFIDPLDASSVKKGFKIIEETIKLVEETLPRRNRLISGF